MYTRSKRARVSLQMTLWADAVAGSARTLQRRREMGWKYRDGAGQSTTAMYAAEQAERRRQRNRRKTQAITAAIVLGVTVPAWAVVNAVSTPSAHNGLATVSDGAPLPGAEGTDDQFAQMLDSAASAPTDGRSDAAWARTVSAAHRFDLPWATDVTTAPAPAPAAPSTKRAADAPAEIAPAPDDLPDDAYVPAGEVGTRPAPAAAAPAPAPDEPTRVTLPEHDRASLDREGVSRVHKHVESRPEEATNPAAPAPAAPTGKTLAGDPADPTRNATTTAPQTPVKPATPAKSVTPAKPGAADPAAPAAAPAAPAEATAPSSDSGGGATKGEGRAADSKPVHGHVAKSDPATP